MKKLKRLGMDYWKYWIASAGSMAASNILQYILALYVMDITGSATIFASMLSIILFPRILLTPLAGVISDRTNRMKAMSFILLGETAVLVISFLITSIVPIHVAGIFAHVTVLEIGEVFYGAAENAVIPKLVDKELLPDAIAVSKADDGMVFVLSPMVAALIYTKLSLPMAFLIVGALDLLGAMFQKSIVSDCSSISEKKEFSFWNEFKEGIEVIKGDSFLRRYIVALPVIDAFFGATFSVSICYLFRIVYNLNAYQYGLYSSVTASTTIWVPILVIPIVQKLKPDKIFRTSTKLIAVEIALIGAFAYMGVAHILPVYVTVIVITLLDCMTIAEAIPMQMAGSILLQTGIEEKYLGRVCSVIGMVTSISIAAGELLFGVLDDQINVPFTILVGAMGVAIGAMIYSFGRQKSKMIA